MKGYSVSFQLFNELSEHLTLRISSCHLMEHPPLWSEKKQHADYDLWILIAGEVQLQMDSTVGVAGPGDMILFYPGMPYFAVAGDNGYRFLYVHFDFDLGNRPRILDDFDLSGILPGASAAEETALLLRAYERYRNQEIASSVGLKGSLTMLLSRIIEQAAAAHAKQARLAGGQPANRSAVHQLDTLVPVFDYLQQHLHHSIAIRELAEQINMSEKYFITFFRNIVGVTPGYYMYQLRMNRARDYLLHGSLTIKQIAERLGYPDPYSFSKAFKKYYNCPPSKFV